MFLCLCLWEWSEQLGEGAERRLLQNSPLPRFQELIQPVGSERCEVGLWVQSWGWRGGSYFTPFPLCFLPRHWGGQSCPDLAQDDSSSSNISFKVGETTKKKALGRAGPENPDSEVRQLGFTSPPSATESPGNRGQITPHL